MPKKQIKKIGLYLAYFFTKEGVQDACVYVGDGTEKDFLKFAKGWSIEKDSLEIMSITQEERGRKTYKISLTEIK